METNDHTILVHISTSLARLESKVDSIVQRIDSLDKRLDDHETRLREIEGDYMSASETRTGRRWLLGLVAAAVVTSLATFASIIFN